MYTTHSSVHMFFCFSSVSLCWLLGDSLTELLATVVVTAICRCSAEGAASKTGVGEGEGGGEEEGEGGEGEERVPATD